MDAPTETSPPRGGKLFRGVTRSKAHGKFRSQISAGGRTVSLGDYVSEADAARAYDRACISRAGSSARTNFPVEEYAAEIDQLTAMSQAEVVALLRSRARSAAGQSSRHRGVSLLRRTGRWHAQINAGGRQIHLGFYPQEEQAARAYDRATLSRWAAGLGADEWGRARAAAGAAGGVGGGEAWWAAGAAPPVPPPTNFEVVGYCDELAVLRSVGHVALVAALADEGRRRATMRLLAHGFGGAAAAAAAAAVFGGPPQGGRSTPPPQPPQPDTPAGAAGLRSPLAGGASKRRKTAAPCRAAAC